MSFHGKDQRICSGRVIQNQPFWPDIDLGILVNDYRMPADLPETVIETELRIAMGTINSRLESLRYTMREKGFSRLTEVPSECINGVSLLLERYTRAVMCAAKAAILREWPSIDRREAAENQARSSAETEDRYLEFADEAVSALLGLGNINVELM